MSIYLGSQAVTLYLGAVEVASPGGAYLDGLQVFPAGPPPADPFATLVSTKSTGDVSGIARSTTGYIKVQWWDSTTNVYETGVAEEGILWSKAAGGAGSKTLLIYPSDASGNLSGALTSLSCSSNSLTSLDVSGLTALTSLNCFNNSLTSLDVSGLTALTSLSCANNSLTSLDVSGLTALTNLSCSSNSLTSLDVSGLTALTNLYCFSNSLTSLDVSGLTALTNLSCENNSLTSLRAVGVSAASAGTYSGSYGSYFYNGGFHVQNNSLSASALDQFYTDLPESAPPEYYTGLIVVTNNPGTAGDDPTIATAKGYTVYGS
jgi:hypothetical protein